MPQPSEHALESLLGTWGIPPETAQASVEDQLADQLGAAGLSPCTISIRWGRATIALAPHHAHLATLMTDQLARTATEASGGTITEVRILVRDALSNIHTTQEDRT